MSWSTVLGWSSQSAKLAMPPAPGGGGAGGGGAAPLIVRPTPGAVTECEPSLKTRVTETGPGVRPEGIRKEI